MSTHNIGFYEDLTKIIFELSSNTHLISSAACANKWLVKINQFTVPNEGDHGEDVTHLAAAEVELSLCWAPYAILLVHVICHNRLI